MPDRLVLPDLPRLRGDRVILREHQEPDIDDRLRLPIDPDEEDCYGSSWRREWDGRRYHTREHLAAASQQPPDPGSYTWSVEHDGHCIGAAGLRVDDGQHRATYTVGLFVPGLRGQGLGREVTRLVLSWAFTVLGVHRVELEVLSDNSRAIRCYLACGFRPEGIRREAELYPDGWKDFIVMALLQPEYVAMTRSLRFAVGSAGRGRSGLVATPTAARPTTCRATMSPYRRLSPFSSSIPPSLPTRTVPSGAPAR